MSRWKFLSSTTLNFLSVRHFLFFCCGMWTNWHYGVFIPELPCLVSHVSVNKFSDHNQVCSPLGLVNILIVIVWKSTCRNYDGEFHSFVIHCALPIATSTLNVFLYMYQDNPRKWVERLKADLWTGECISSKLVHLDEPTLIFDHFAFESGTEIW